MSDFELTPPTPEDDPVPTGREPWIHLVVPGDPVPQPRPRARMAPVGGTAEMIARARQAKTIRHLYGLFNVQIYTPPGAKGNESVMDWRGRAEHAMNAAKRRSGYGARPLAPQGHPIEVALLFVTELPQSKWRKTIAIGQSWCRSQRAGDLDNLTKAFLDAASGVLFHDDAQVSVLSAEKIVGAQGELPRSEMLARPLNIGEPPMTRFELMLDQVPIEERDGERTCTNPARRDPDPGSHEESPF